MLFPELPTADHDRARAYLGEAMQLMRDVDPDGRMETVLADSDDWYLEMAMIGADSPYADALGWRSPCRAGDRLRLVWCPARMAAHLARLEDQAGTATVELYLDAVAQHLAIHLSLWRRWPDDADDDRDAEARNMLADTFTDGPGSHDYLTVLGDVELRSALDRSA